MNRNRCILGVHRSRAQVVSCQAYELCVGVNAPQSHSDCQGWQCLSYLWLWTYQLFYNHVVTRQSNDRFGVKQNCYTSLPQIIGHSDDGCLTFKNLLLWPKPTVLFKGLSAIVSCKTNSCLSRNVSSDILSIKIWLCQNPAVVNGRFARLNA